MEKAEQSGLDYFWRQVSKYLDEYQKDLFTKFYENAKVIEKKPIEDITAEKILHKNIDWVFASDDDKNKFIKAMNEFAEIKCNILKHENTNTKTIN